MATFKLLAEIPLYKKVITYTDGQFVDGYWEEGTPIVTYEEFSGRWQAYTRGNELESLPSGVKSSDMIKLRTEYNLQVGSDLTGQEGVPDIIYLEDPTTVPNTPAYTVYDREKHKLQGSFTLINNDFNNYVCIRLGKGAQ